MRDACSCAILQNSEFIWSLAVGWRPPRRPSLLSWRPLLLGTRTLLGWHYYWEQEATSNKGISTSKDAIGGHRYSRLKFEVGRSSAHPGPVAAVADARPGIGLKCLGVEAWFFKVTELDILVLIMVYPGLRSQAGLFHNQGLQKDHFEEAGACVLYLNSPQTSPGLDP